MSNYTQSELLENFVLEFLSKKYDEKFTVEIWDNSKCLAVKGSRGSRFQFYFKDLIKGKLIPVGISSKTCILINGRFSWELQVDGMRIPFQGALSSEYFDKHYSGLGYEVILKDGSNLTEEEVKL